ncbi:hypothetical protein M153_9000017276 [Pseudoloma neurophilia]|uniref:Uncharacterized protein n=1 Tax=Pseudoloma neurophilia TaxID=146866 RepID=A0A0R0M778_9MICR|nr:hypothetical protein M153_9000017276 [Pseudoloma neurophilia]
MLFVENFFIMVLSASTNSIIIHPIIFMYNQPCQTKKKFDEYLCCVVLKNIRG